MERRPTYTPPLKNRDQVADLILDRLQGYARRQATVPHDRAYLRMLLDRWDAEVADLQAQLAAAKVVPRVIYRPRERKFLDYLGFLIGLRECPTL